MSTADPLNPIGGLERGVVQQGEPLANMAPDTYPLL
jgi:hypothetical protein